MTSQIDPRLAAELDAAAPGAVVAALVTIEGPAGEFRGLVDREAEALGCGPGETRAFDRVGVVEVRGPVELVKRVVHLNRVTSATTTDAGFTKP